MIKELENRACEGRLQNLGCLCEGSEGRRGKAGLLRNSFERVRAKKIQQQQKDTGKSML